MTARIALIYPEAPPEEWRIDQRMAGLRLRFGNDARIDLVAVKPGKQFKEAPPDKPQPIFAAHLTTFDHAAGFWEDEATLAITGVTHRVSSIGRVLPLRGSPLTEDDVPHLDTHAFNRLAPLGPNEIEYGCLQLFPYGYTYSYPGLGVTDAFGHRIVGDFRDLRSRTSDHKLVVCFGGSAVWGTTVLQPQCFPAQLQTLLQQSSAKPITVLNFGIPAATVLNATQRYILFATELRPDIVILHDGVNDLFYAQSSDPWLVTRHQMSYQPTMETWAGVLRSMATGKAIAPSSKKCAPLVDIVRAFLRRKREFVHVARSLGGRVISGLQPWSESKTALSELERNRISRSWGGNPYSAECALVRGGYALLHSEKPTVGADHELSFHDLFATYGSDQTLFADRVHLDVAGEAAIARVYADAVTNILNPKSGRAPI